MKDHFGGVTVDNCIGLKSKMYSLKKIGSKECNIANWLSIATDFNKCKDVSLNKKIVRHKMRRV